VKTRRAALYVRVSTGEQNTEAQQAALREYVDRRGWVVHRLYEDKGISGASTTRPALNQMLQDCRRGGINVVVVWKFDRPGKSTTGTGFGLVREDYVYWETLSRKSLLRREKRGRCPTAFGKDKYSSAGAGDLRSTRYEVLPCGPFCMQVIDFSWCWIASSFEFPFINPVAAIRFDFINEQGTSGTGGLFVLALQTAPRREYACSASAQVGYF